MSFKKNFYWGVATAAHQIEGAPFEDGKGASVWDEFATVDGKIKDNQNANVACDHYHRFKEDVKLMADLGIKSYRFSIAWSRILPKGIGEINEKGIKFYSDLLDELKKYDIKPFITLYHWDLPLALQKMGGWLNPNSPKWFEEYTRVVVTHLGEKISDIITFNEPQCFIGVAHSRGDHAPGILLPTKDTVAISHHVLKAHGLSVLAIRELCKHCKIGFAPTGSGCYPETESDENIEAARKAYFSIPNKENEWWWNVSWFSDPVMLGSYPEEGLKLYGKYLPDGWQEDLKTIHQPLDFYGQNLYHGPAVRAKEDGSFEYCEREFGYSHTDMGWPVTPKSLYWGPKFLYERYGKPIIITENGMACHDWVSLDGKVHDPNRIDYLARYLSELKKASQDGIQIDGYFLWTFTDNFEWSLGYQVRLGLVYTDFKTQNRIPKDSAHWYSDVIKSNGENLGETK